MLASGAADGSLQLWDPAERQALGDSLVGPPGSLLSLAFTLPETGPYRMLFTGSADGVLLRWNTDVTYWRERSCEIAGRNFSQAEWAQYFPGLLYRQTCSQWLAGE
jgi:WD40 repeat protein